MQDDYSALCGKLFLPSIFLHRNPKILAIIPMNRNIKMGIQSKSNGPPNLCLGNIIAEIERIEYKIEDIKKGIVLRFSL